MQKSSFFNAVFTKYAIVLYGAVLLTSNNYENVYIPAPVNINAPQPMVQQLQPVQYVPQGTPVQQVQQVSVQAVPVTVVTPQYLPATPQVVMPQTAQDNDAFYQQMYNQ